MFQKNAIGVFPTETVYGIGTNAFNVRGVETIFQIKERPIAKPLAVLVSDIELLKLFGISEVMARRAQQYWTSPTTVILPCKSKKWYYLHRGSGGLAFRVPEEPSFKNFLRATGPLAVTSANKSGEITVHDPYQAFKIFGDTVDFYMELNPKAVDKPSKVISLVTGKPIIIRS